MTGSRPCFLHHSNHRALDTRLWSQMWRGTSGVNTSCASEPNGAERWTPHLSGLWWRSSAFLAFGLSGWTWPWVWLLETTVYWGRPPCRSAWRDCEQSERETQLMKTETPSAGQTVMRERHWSTCCAGTRRAPGSACWETLAAGRWSEGRGLPKTDTTWCKRVPRSTRCR